MKRKKRYVNSDMIFDIINYSFMAILLCIFIWPLWFVLIASFSDPNAVWAGKVILIPKSFNLECYKRILGYKQLWVGYRNTILYTVSGTALNIIMTILIAFPLSRKKFMFKGFITKMFMITMYFGGGLIPNYLLVQSLGMVNTPFALIIPGAVSFFNVIIAKSFFENSIPSSLEEASYIDGAGMATYFWKIVVPLSKAIIAVLVLYYAVGHWNNYFSALIYINEPKFQPLQIVLRSILINNSTAEMMDSGVDIMEQLEQIKMAETMKYGIIIVSSVPLLCVYPFIQKYFVKGVMIGAIKG